MAVEEATNHGVDINATVSFTVPQSIAVAEAVERGLNRRAKEGKPVADMTPVCTVMIGRLDDWLQVVAKKENIVVDPGYLHWAGIAAIKRSYEIYRQKGYRTRLLAAAYRHHMHWSELIGGDLSMTIPYEWQVLFNNSDIEVKPRMQNPVPKEAYDVIREGCPLPAICGRVCQHPCQDKCNRQDVDEPLAVRDLKLGDKYAVITQGEVSVATIVAAAEEVDLSPQARRLSRFLRSKNGTVSF